MGNETNLNEDLNNRSGVGQSEFVQMPSGYWQRIIQNFQRIIHNKVLIKTVKKTLLVTSIIFMVLFFFSFFLYIVPGMQETGKSRNFRTTNTAELKKDLSYKKQLLSLTRDLQRLKRKFIAFTPGQSFLVINTTYNRFSLFRNKELLREGFCSSGSYTRLTNAEGSRQWIFKTPKGKFSIQEKITNPLWIRPDWSFVEEGSPIPAPNDESRYEYGVLGDFAMSLGDGYLIHGTLYKRFLGMPVTHGCVRLNDDDLKTIYNTLNIGSKVFIF